MKLLQITRNTLSFTGKQGKTSWLIFLYPIVLIFLVGIGLNMGAANRLPVAVYGVDPIMDIMQDSGEPIELFSVNSEAELRSAVRSKEAIMGISFEDDSSRKKISIYFDSTKQAVASGLLLLLDKAINEEKVESGESLGALQRLLAPKVAEIREKEREMEEFSGRIDELRNYLSSARNDLFAAKSQLSSYKSELQDYKGDLGALDTYVSRLNDYESDLVSLRSSLNSREQQRDEVSAKLSTHLENIDYYLADVQSAINYVSSAKALAPQPSALYDYLDDAHSRLLDLRRDLQAARSDLTSMRTQLNSIDFASMRNAINNLQQDIRSTRQDISSFKHSSTTRMNSLISDIDSASSKIDGSLSDIDSFLEELEVLETKASETSELLGSIAGPLEEFVEKEPGELIPPEVVSEPVFGQRDWIDLFFPTIIAVDILLASVLLPMIMRVRMKEQGVELRLMRSRAGSFSVVLGESLAYYLISLSQLLLISLIAVSVFGVGVGNLAFFAVVMLTVPVVFTAIGVLFAQIVKTSTSAFLLSLLLSIPMIFISGAIIPIELMNPIISYLGTLTPLYVTIDFAEKMLFRGAAYLAVGDFAYLGTLSAFCLLSAVAVFYSKR